MSDGLGADPYFNVYPAFQNHAECRFSSSWRCSLNRQQIWDERYAAKDLVWSAGPNQLFAEQAQSITAGTALDVACGEGRNALWLAEQGWRVTGIDFSSVGINKARQIAKRRGVEVNWIAADVVTSTLPEAGFDLVLVAYFHTDPDTRRQWLPKVVGAVNPGGTFIYIGHDPRNIEHGVGGPQDEQLLPDADAIVAALAGFQIQAAEVVERPVAADPGHGPDNGGVAVDTFVRAVRQ